MNKPKVVHKPWGKEVWLELNDKYCYKRIYINQGYKTSYQYHKYKRETNYIISGTAEVWLENDNGIVEKMIMNEGDFFNVIPPKKHRVIALTDIILQEVSTPEVDDVIRLEDDTDREDGRLDYEHNNMCMCIVAAGMGSRLGNLSENFHKALLPIGNKAAISHIIDKTPIDTDIIIAVGYNSDLIKQYVNIAHSDRNILYVDVENIDGVGSGPGYSLYKCKEFLQRPFYFTTVDCIIKDDLPKLDGNWLGVYPTSIPEIYSTVDIDEKCIIRNFVNKSNNGYSNAFIGLCGIYEFNTFWKNLEDNLVDGEVVNAFLNINSYKKFKSKHLEWYDIGTIENYIHACNTFNDGNTYGIPKNNGQIVYKVNDKFIKYNRNSKVISNIVIRGNNLDKITPKIKNYNKNIFSYDWIDGYTLYDINKINTFTDFLNWAQLNMWKPESVSLNNECELFYKKKTIDRLNMFYNLRDFDFEKKFTVNGKECVSIKKILRKINWDEFYDCIPTKIFHGDLQFDNIIKTDSDFKLIDWRSDFGGNTTYGDVYYDLAKLYGGVLISYKNMKDDSNIEYHMNSNTITFSYKNPNKLNTFLKIYENWLLENNFNLDKIRKLTALIFLNMSPLHSEKFGNMLFFKAISILTDYYDK